jgi:sugar lactone lactonase YvrE
MTQTSETHTIPGVGPTLLVEGLGFGEGLRWHDDRLWFSDFLEHRVSSLGLDGDVRVEAELDDRPSGLGWLPDGRLLVVSMQDRLVLRREPDGKLVTHADLSPVAASHANDMVVAEDGTAYVGNFGSDALAGAGRATAQLAIVRPDGTVLGGPDDLEFPNGSVITADGATLIVGESYARRYRAFPIAADGTLGPGRVWAEVAGRAPDGCTLDAEGAIWFANAIGRDVARVREGGEVTDVIALPDGCYACALGGPDGRTLFVATAGTLPTPDAPSGTGRLWSIDVDVRRAGRP